MFAYLKAPWWTLGSCLVLLALAASQFDKFRFDASSETLVVQGDPDLAAYERVVATFGGDDFLFLTFAPHEGAPLGPTGLERLEELAVALEQIDGVSGVFSALDAPLLNSPPMSLAELLEGVRTLRSPEADADLAARELSDSPVFRELLITKDGSASAIRIDLAPPEALISADAARADAVTPEQRAQAATAYREAREGYLADRERLIEELRQVQEAFRGHGTLHLGGVPMIAADMIRYVKQDLVVFSGLVVGLMVIAMASFFRRLRWVVLPIASAALTVVYTVGLLGFLEWQATVISSNFVSLLAITSVSLAIHLIVQYRELLHTQPDDPHRDLVFSTLRLKLAPCVYTALTTMAAFGSLTASGILPVADMGWMMVMGIAISLVVTFTFFPAVLLLLPKGQAASTVGKTHHFIRALGEFARWRAGWIVLFSAILAVVVANGISRVSLDNRFAEYFDEDTEIYQGMRFIDENLGGTIPFDVVVQFDPYEDLSFDEEDDFAFDDFEDEADPYPERYWFNRTKLDRLQRLHGYLEAQPHVGKVMSLTSLEQLAMTFTDGEPLGNLEIAGVLGAIPPDLLSELIEPYAAPSEGQLRLTGRVIESGPSFDRAKFADEIRQYAVAEGVVANEEEVVVTGMMVLFNGMLNKLLSSQLDTLKYVLAAVFVMFLLLLRSLPHALLGMIPNVLAASTVIGLMGYFGIPLDMMTTTIAAVCIGIGVDDTIHYLHRFQLEYDRWGDARVAVSFSHASIGQALYYTSLTVILGFSVLTFSNFVPTVMFGVWTAVAMALALLANVTLLPALLVLTHADKVPDPTVRV